MRANNPEPNIAVRNICDAEREVFVKFSERFFKRFSLEGSDIYVPMPDGDITAKVTKPIFYDPKGERLNVL